MNSKVIYKKYPKQVQEYMDNVIDCLLQDYKEIPKSWRISLDLIADNYDTYLKAKQDIDTNGLIVHNKKDDGGHRNPSFSVMNVAQDHIVRLLQSFALTPMSRSKMKNFDSEEADFESLLKV